ncbi:MAG: site-2 protease family protein [Halanaerobiales bacterium]
MKVWGLTIRVNPLFLLILVIFFLLGMIEQVLIAFSLVILHEFVHMFTALYYGYKVTKIELFPFGGMAEYTGLLEMKPWQEIKVALAGPVFNIVFASILYILLFLNIIETNKYINLLLEYNIIIASINLIPILPLDGGRALRGVLILIYGIKKGNTIAFKMARFFVYIGILLGILVLVLNRANIWFLFFFFFIYGMINKEEKQLFYYFLRYLSRRNEIFKDFAVKELSGRVVYDNLPIKDAIYHINPVKYNLFFVLDSQFNIKGIISEARLIKSYFNHRDKEIRMRDIL